MSDMKCPFCGQKLGRKNINDRMCSNEKCVSWKGNFYASEDLWQELIRTRKALDVALKGLDDIIDSGGDGYWTAIKTKEQITALEQKDVK